jgi:hypothetical protein
MLVKIKDRIINTNAIIDVMPINDGKNYLMRLTPQNPIYPENESRVLMSPEEGKAFVHALLDAGLLKALTV